MCARLLLHIANGAYNGLEWQGGGVSKSIGHIDLGWAFAGDLLSQNGLIVLWQSMCVDTCNVKDCLLCSIVRVFITSFDLSVHW